MEVAGPLGTPLGLAQRKRASPRGEAGTSGFLCVSDSDRRVPAELGTIKKKERGGCGRKQWKEERKKRRKRKEGRMGREEEGKKAAKRKMSKSQEQYPLIEEKNANEQQGNERHRI